MNSYLKHEIILYQKEKRSKILQVKTLSKDVRKTIVPSFMFLFNLSLIVSNIMVKALFQELRCYVVKASVKTVKASVKTACVCLVFFSHYFKYYG